MEDNDGMDREDEQSAAGGAPPICMGVAWLTA